MKQPGNDKVSYPCCPMDFVHQRCRVTTLLFFQASFVIGAGALQSLHGVHGYEWVFVYGLGRGLDVRNLRGLSECADACTRL